MPTLRNTLIANLLIICVSVPSQAQPRRPLTPPSRLSPSLINKPSPEVPSKTQNKLPTGFIPRFENLTNFQPRLVRLQWRERRWILEGGGLYKEFDSREAEARQAFQAIRALQLDQHGVIGKPKPVLEYWLSRGRAPQGLSSGMRTIDFDRQSIKAQEIEGEWFVRDARRVLFRFGASKEDAEQAVAVIKKYGFDQLALIGQAVPSMMIFFQRMDRRMQAMKPFVSQRPIQKSKLDQKPHPWTKQDKAQSTILTSVVPRLRPQGQKAEQDWSRYRILPRERTSLTSPNQTAHKPQPLPSGITRTVFNYRQLTVVREKGDWKLKAGSLEIGNFGVSKYQAELASAAMMYYRLNELYQIPKTNVKYFLSMGQPPRGRMHGLVFDYLSGSEARIVRRTQHYSLTDGRRTNINCGPNEQSAKHLLQVIQHYGFDHRCRIGTSDKYSLQFFVRSY